MKNIRSMCQGWPILINLDQIVAIGVCQYDSTKTWIDMTNGEEYTIDTPYSKVLKFISDVGEGPTRSPARPALLEEE